VYNSQGFLLSNQMIDDEKRSPMTPFFFFFHTSDRRRGRHRNMRLKSQEAVRLSHMFVLCKNIKIGFEKNGSQLDNETNARDRDVGSNRTRTSRIGSVSTRFVMYTNLVTSVFNYTHTSILIIKGAAFFTSIQNNPPQSALPHHDGSYIIVLKKTFLLQMSTPWMEGQNPIG
jgi:hypothetical protein